MGIVKSSDADVLIVGAGPAGAVAATLLARAGARVRVFDRAVFPRDKLCGDTVNPGTVAILDRLGIARALDTCGLPIHGMRISGANGVVVEARYPARAVGRALVRRQFDWMLVQDAVSAGVQLEPGVAVRRALVENGRVTGLVLDRDCELRAPVTIAADGRRSSLAFALGLAAHPVRPRRWAIGAYFELGRDETGDVLGEMHVRGDHYIGIAAVPGGLTNVCLVQEWRAGNRPIQNPSAALAQVLASDVVLRERFASARMVAPPVVLGPLAVDVTPQSVNGLLSAGDAAGFIDPMTGDGLRFAIRGAELVAHSALDVLEHGWDGIHANLAAARRAEFGAKWRFNRAVRALVASPSAVAAAAAGARLAPALLRRAMVYAGDCV